MAKRKVPSQAANGADTFNDNLVGFQITDGTSQFTNTNFALDVVIPEKDSKNFVTSAFSEFLSLDDLKQEDAVSTKVTRRRTDTVRFKASKDNANKSLFGSLKKRLLVALKNIVTDFPATMMVESDSPTGDSNLAAKNISYDKNFQTTDLEIDAAMIYNPFEILLKTPVSTNQSNNLNPIRKFYSSYKKYNIEINGTQYPILDYTEPNTNNVITLTVKGKPFTGATYSTNFLIKPNNGVVEEFYNNLDELEQVLLNRDTNPIFTANFLVPRDSFDKTSTVLTGVEISWPISKDGWNPQIVGLRYLQYVNDLSNVADEIDEYKSNLIVRQLTSPQLYEFDSEDGKIEALFQLYGQNFDSVKKYIDNIAYMRNVTYDSVNNVPDVLLKNLANTLGLDTYNLIDEKTVEDLLYNRATSEFEGLQFGKTLEESEYEFYRRILVNLAYLYKSKGTRKSIEFLLRFLGAPEPMIKIDEYVYKVTSMPKSYDLEGDIFDAILFSGTTFSRAGYPVKEDTLLPRKAFDSASDIFFQKGAGWYEKTNLHRSRSVLDEDNSILTGRTKTIKTKSKTHIW